MAALKKSMAYFQSEGIDVCTKIVNIYSSAEFDQLFVDI